MTEKNSAKQKKTQKKSERKNLLFEKKKMQANVEC